MHQPFVSIIIPAFNDIERLRQCLELLEAQTYDHASYEVIVVDNNSSEDLRPIVAQFSQSVYAFEPIAGSYKARNLGLSVAKGDVIGFTDSDCSPTSDWIENGVSQIMKHPNCGFVAGKIRFSFKDSSSPTPAEIYDSLHFLQQEKYVRDGHFGVTANLFTRRKVIEDVGSFDATLKSGGDRDWGKRVYAAGYSQIYAEDVQISHPARSDMKALSKKLRRVYKGDFQARNQSELPPLKFVGQVLKDAKPPFSYLMRILRDDEIVSVRKRISVVYIYVYIKLMKSMVKLKLYFT